FGVGGPGGESDGLEVAVAERGLEPGAFELPGDVSFGELAAAGAGRAALEQVAREEAGVRADGGGADAGGGAREGRRVAGGRAGVLRACAWRRGDEYGEAEQCARGNADAPRPRARGAAAASHHGFSGR